MQDTGQLRNVNYDDYYLVLKSPDGVQSTQQVNNVQFRESIIGERLGLKSTDPTARKAALTTEITAAEKDLETVVAQREAKEAEKRRADGEVEALARKAKGSKKGSGAERKAQAEARATRLGQELDAVTMDEDDKRLRLTQLREERDNVDKPKPATPAPATASTAAPAQ